GETLPDALPLESTQPEEVTELEDGDDDGDARGEAGGHRVRDELDETAQSGDAHRQHDQTGQESGDEKPTQAVPGGDRDQQHHECGGGPGYRVGGAPGEGDQQTGDDRRVQAVLGRRAGGDGQCHGQRQRHHADDETGDGVCPQIGGRVTPTEGGPDGNTDPDLGVVVDDHPGHVWRKITVCFPPTPTSAPLAVAVPSPGYAGGLIRSDTSLPPRPLAVAVPSPGYAGGLIRSDTSLPPRPLAVAVPSPGYAGGLIRSDTSLPPRPLAGAVPSPGYAGGLIRSDTSLPPRPLAGAVPSPGLAG